jgi:2-polyprenyl-3-methyl-5-hydroxy-6-metoxy-1,4-benzoquinol methylase
MGVVAPGESDVINVLRRALSAILPYRTLRGGRAKMNAHYALGKWDYLRGIEELGRFSILVGYCQFLKPGGRILEIGCGEGILRERLDATRYSRYVGVDISDEAIQRAKPEPKAQFVCSDATAWEPNETFDLIVFNECLEYFHDPLSVVGRYEPYLAPEGAFLVSMFAGIETARTRRIWRWLESVYRVEDATRITNRENLTWVLKVLRPCGSA